MADEVLVRIAGDVEQPLQFTHNDFASFFEADQVRDVSRIDARRQGDGVTLKSVVQRVRPTGAATHMTLRSTIDGFSASVELDAVRARGILVYQIENRQLSQSEGGPIRFLIADSAACRTEDLDDCANVKFVDEIIFTSGKSPDSRGERAT